MEKDILLSSKDYSFILGRIYFTSNDGFQNMFVYQPIFNTLKYKNMSTEYIISWKLKGVYNSKLKGLNCNFLHNIKYFDKYILIGQKFLTEILH